MHKNMDSHKTNNRKNRFEEVALDYKDALYNRAYYLTKNKFDAEDLIQDTYMKAYRYFDSFEEGTYFKSWIFKILYNNYMSFYSQKAKTNQQVDFDYFLETHSGRESEEDFQPERLEDQIDDEIYRAIKNIPSYYSIVVILVDLYQLSYEKAATLLNCPIGTVMSRLFRARKRLRKSLSNYGKKYGYQQN